MTAMSSRLDDWVGPASGGTDMIWRRSLLMLVGMWVGILLLFWRDAADMAVIWWTSSTFNHCLLILPILGWLVVMRKTELAALVPVTWWLPLLYVAAGSFGWLLGDAASVALARQLGLIMMLQGTAAALLGPNVTRGLSFPLFYMFFLLPFGEEAVPALQLVTADMCMFLLGLFGIPAHIEGIFISTPAGLFRVAEACSGVKFLIAMVALGALISNLCFTSWNRRAIFMAACFIVPIIANGIRAFATIYIAEFRGIESAAGFDHVFYGWIFFGIVIAVIIGGAWRYFDKSPDAPAFDPARLQMPARFQVSAKAVMIGLGLIIAIPAAWPVIISAQVPPLPEQIDLPRPAGWQIVDHQSGQHWSPRFDGASRILYARYRNRAGQEVDFFAALYDRQSEGREIVGYGQGAIDPDGGWSWVENIPAPQGAKAEKIMGAGGVLRDVVSYYRIGGVTSGSASRIKLATMKAKLLGGDQQAAAILLSAPYKGKASQIAAINGFANDMGNIDKVADQMMGVR
ncbi:exosortase A [Sphingorhabdus arenilitoris]|uniref:Exosortase A n=1 Tax=Sphingorhabdus arenilitoris TaxID=1490041 RepID=A0ABV8RG53_9SPHN